jgi:hypothetical protein
MTHEAGLTPQRRIELEQALVDTRSRLEVQVKYAEKWGVTTRTIRNYIAFIARQWEKRSEASWPGRRERYKKLCEESYRKAMLGGDYKAAHQWMEMLMTLDGEWGPGRIQRHDQSGTGERPRSVTSMTPVEAKAELERLEAVYHAQQTPATPEPLKA